MYAQEDRWAGVMVVRLQRLCDDAARSAANAAQERLISTFQEAERAPIGWIQWALLCIISDECSTVCMSAGIEDLCGLSWEVGMSKALPSMADH